MLKTLIFTLATLVVVLMSNVQTGRAEDSDTLWTKDLSGNGFVINTLFSPDDRTIFVTTTEKFFELDALTGNIIREIPGIRGMERFIDDFKYFISYDYKKYSYPDMILIKDYEAIFKRNSFGGIGGYDIDQIGNYMYCVIDSLYYGNISYSNFYIFDLLNEKEIYRKELDENYDRIAISKDLKTMVTFSYYLGVVSDDNDDKALLKVWDLQTKSLQKVIFEKKPTDMMKNYLKFSPDGNYFAYLESSYIYLYDTKTWELVDTFTIDGFALNSFTFSKDSKSIFLTESGFETHLYQIIPKHLIKTFPPQKGSQDIIISNNNQFLIALSGYDVYLLKNSLTSVIGNNDFINIYPNPVKNILSLQNTIGIIENATLCSVIGTVLNSTLDYIQSDNTLKFDFSNLKAGAYLLTLNSDNQVLTVKFIKE